jgi:hypothetical protein
MFANPKERLIERREPLLTIEDKKCVLIVAEDRGSLELAGSKDTLLSR